MEQSIRANFDQLHSKNAEARTEAYQKAIALTNTPVDWAYEVWEELLDMTRNGDNHQRTIAVQLLCNMAKSDPKGKMLKDFDALIAVTRDEKFVTARHSLQALWKVGLAGNKQLKLVLDGYVGRFKDCAVEKNCTLIRYDITVALKKLHDEVKDEKVRETSLALIETEADLKYRKKYAGVWKAG
jgi:hypothetical protein